MRTLLVEDDTSAAQSVELMLKSWGHKVEVSAEGEEALELAKLYDYDLILLDMNLPDLHGLDVVQKLRAANLRTPIIALTISSDVTSKVGALRCGCDDYIVKPFASAELEQRILAVTRRAANAARNELPIGPLVLNLESKTAMIGGRKLHLTGKEYQILELMGRRRGRVLSKEVFMNHLYGGMDEPELKIIDVFVCKLRAKLKVVGVTDLIQTVWGRGYLIASEDAAA